jgi:hypothetical protein
MDAKELRGAATAYLESGQFESGNKLAFHILATVPADDGEPVTTGWLESIGFKHSNRNGGQFEIEGSYEGEFQCEVRLSIRTCNCMWLINGIRVRDQESRGDVRRLLAALGIDGKVG